jgi:hypothetical protein
MARIVTPTGEIVEWPYLSRDKPVQIEAGKLRACLSKKAIDRARAAASLTPREVRRVFERPARWASLARAWKRIARWKVEEIAAKLGERELVWCTQGGSRTAFFSRAVRSGAGANVRPRYNAGLVRVVTNGGELDASPCSRPKTACRSPAKEAETEKNIKEA